MPRLPRFDGPGSWHHVMNRGIARRTVFETRADVRMFLAFLAREVRRGTIEVHAFAIVTTHVHLLVRSPAGELAAAMKRVFNGYVRYFNRGRRRDGSLFRGRYRSRLVESRNYRLLLVTYIDLNPVQAGLVKAPADFPHGSARSWATGRLPPWLARGWLTDVLGAPAGSAEASARYVARFHGEWEQGLEALIEGRLNHRRPAEDPLDNLLEAAPEAVLAWMKRKAALADQTKPGLPLLPPSAVLERWRASNTALAGALQSRRGPTRPLRDIARAALLRDLCGMTFQRIAAQLNTVPSQCRQDYLRHGLLMKSDAEYGRVIREIATNALDRVYRRAGQPV